MYTDMYEYDLKKLYEDYFNGNRDAGLKINGILTFKTDYGDFTSTDDLFKANDMLRKCENAVGQAIVSNPFKSLCLESIKKSYERIEALWHERVSYYIFN